MIPEVEQYIRALTSANPEITAIWLIGSRANNKANHNSDWDVLVFCNSPILDKLSEDTRFHKHELDLFVVFNSDGDFVNPWDNSKKGNLGGWGWSEMSVREATYESVKFISGKLHTERLQAVKIFP